MKVFVAVSSLKASYGGPAYSVARVATGLAASGVEAGIWAADDSAADAPSIDGDSRAMRLSGSVQHALERFGMPDLVHDNGLWLRHNHWLARMCARESIPRVASVRGMLEPWAFKHKQWKKRAAWLLYQRRDLESADLLHVTGELEAASVAAFRLRPPIQVIPNGVELPKLEDIRRRESSGAQGMRTALFLGRIYPIKGLPMLIKAWDLVRPAGWRLKIVGPDEAGHQAELERLVEATGLRDAISFPGPVLGDTKLAAFVDADLFVLSSHSESFGMAAAEALAHELPVLATRTTPWPMLEEKKCGWLVEPTVEGLADGLRRATSNDAQSLREMGREGRKLVEAQFGWDRIVGDFVRTYEQLIRLHRRG